MPLCYALPKSFSRVRFCLHWAFYRVIFCSSFHTRSNTHYTFTLLVNIEKVLFFRWCWTTWLSVSAIIEVIHFSWPVNSLRQKMQTRLRIDIVNLSGDSVLIPSLFEEKFINSGPTLIVNYLWFMRTTVWFVRIIVFAIFNVIFCCFLLCQPYVN